MKQDYSEILKPDIINSVTGLALISRVIVDQYLAGLNQSRRVGLGMEFSQYRGYEPGDDMRLLDWKMLARSGRYYIKQSEIETHINVKFFIDSSKSMLHEENGLSKIDFAKVIVAALANLAQSQGDAIGLITINDQYVQSVPPRMQKQHYNRFLHELISIQSKGQLPKNLNSLDKIHNRNQKELLFFITDLYEYNTELSQIIEQLKTSRNEVVVFHIMGKSELMFDYQGQAIFEDLETGIRLKVDPREVKKQYLKAIQDEIEQIKNKLLTNNISYEMFRLDEPIGEALQLFLKKRARLL
ncbi:uncharacterized protein (DUF58 family) [Saonia flava]|uniref:Uncharacterized protein (DUF58 family) n=1 Tax=Saonia flava TaxID=523696 RepID=A0A846R072_9FLAO|nr:DUF58 domain-containing protein [Saonia flava]NJB70269.1 uncharacterized protein (DUF58 family) [Saonia flava]